MISSEHTASLYEALAEARKEFPAIAKNTENPFFHAKYADYNSIREAIDPVLEKHDLVVLMVPDAIGELPALTITLKHNRSGEYVQSTTPLSLTKKDPQAHGSALTYMKRYGLTTVLGLKNVDEDDDGNVATQPDNKVTRSGKVADDKAPSRAAGNQRQELEAAFAAAGMSKVKGTKWYHDEFGKDYKTDPDEGNLAAAIVKLAGLTGD